MGIAVIGSTIGDIAGSVYEFSLPLNFKPYEVPLLHKRAFFTDDTVLTLATKYAVKNHVPYEDAYRSFTRKYPEAGYGGNFLSWAASDTAGPYNSYGNGSAMRVSYIGEAFDTLEEVRREAVASAQVTHSHIQGKKGAACTAECVWLARKGYDQEFIRKYVRDNFRYDVDTPLSERIPGAMYEISCQKTLPVALCCFLESTDYESCIRNVFRIRCDTDTVGAIAGGIAAAYYKTTGMDEREVLKKYLSEELYELAVDDIGQHEVQKM